MFHDLNSERKIMLQDFSDDLIHHFAMYYLDVRSIQALRCVSPKYHQLFSQKLNLDWVKKIANNFQLCEKTLASLPISKNIKALQLGHRVFSSFKSSKHELLTLKTISRYFINHIDNQLLIFVCGTDDITSFLEIADPTDILILFEISLYLGCINIPKQLYNLTRASIQGQDALLSFEMIIVNHAVISGRLDIVRFLIEDAKLKFKNIHHDVLVNAAASGNIALINYFIEKHKLELSKIVVRLNPLNYAAKYGHLPMTKHLLNLGAKINNQTLDYAATSGCLSLVKFFIDEHQQIPTQTTLEKAVSSGNQALFDFLITNANTFTQIHPENIKFETYLASENPDFQFKTISSWIAQSTRSWRLNHLNKIAASGNFELFKMALNKPIPGMSLQLTSALTQPILDDAASSGNVEMVQYILDHSELKPNQQTLDQAVRSQNLALVNYLLKPSNRIYGFNLIEIKTSAQLNTIDLLLLSHRSFSEGIVNLLNLVQDAQETKRLIADMFPNGQVTIELIIRNSFLLSFQYSPIHCAESFKEILLHWGEYELDKPTVEFLFNEFKAVLELFTATINDKPSPFMEKIILSSETWLRDNETNILPQHADPKENVHNFRGMK